MYHRFNHSLFVYPTDSCVKLFRLCKISRKKRHLTLNQHRAKHHSIFRFYFTCFSSAAFLLRFLSSSLSVWPEMQRCRARCSRLRSRAFLSRVRRRYFSQRFHLPRENSSRKIWIREISRPSAILDDDDTHLIYFSLALLLSLDTLFFFFASQSIQIHFL